MAAAATLAGMPHPDQTVQRRRGDGPPVTHWIAEGAVAARPSRRDAVFRRALVMADVGAAVFALASAVVVVGGPTPHVAVVAGLPLLLLCAKITGLYDRDEVLIRKTSTVDEVPRLFFVSTLFALLAAIAAPLVMRGELGEGTLAALWLSLFVLLSLFRSAARSFALRVTAAERCVVAGDADGCARLESVLDGNPHSNSCIVGYVPLHPKRTDDPPELGTFAELEAVLLAHEADRVIVVPRDPDSDAALDVVQRVKALGMWVSVVPRILEVIGSSVEFDDVESVTLLGLRRFGLSRGARALKRGLDLAGATAMLIVLLPVFLACSVALRLDSRGPVFFRQRRVGRDGHVFHIVKFRTMVLDAEARKDELLEEDDAGGLFKLTDDPRITRVGRWLRRSSLDELPQLLNVLRGEMSLVGPRPLVLDEDRQIMGWHRRRLHLKPGITGPWQILSSGRVPLYEMVKLDYVYVANWSLWTDVKILLRTVPYSLARRGL